MQASELIGKKAIRTGPTGYGDYSYTERPLLILAVTEHHVIVRNCTRIDVAVFGSRKHILDCRWVDDNWTDYDELMNLSRLIWSDRLEAEKDLDKLLVKYVA